jgi:hypothetical protein
LRRWGLCGGDVRTKDGVRKEERVSDHGEKNSNVCVWAAAC